MFRVRCSVFSCASDAVSEGSWVEKSVFFFVLSFVLSFVDVDADKAQHEVQGNVSQTRPASGNRLHKYPHFSVVRAGRTAYDNPSFILDQPMRCTV